MEEPKAAGIQTNDFMLQIQSDLIESRGIAESTSIQYLQNLWKLSGEKTFKNLAWTKKTADVQAIIDTYAPSTQLSLYTTLVSVLSLIKDKPTYAKTLRHWLGKMKSALAEKSKEDPHEKTEEQAKNWIDWDDVLKKKAELSEDLSSFISNKKLTMKEFEKLTDFLILSLYTDLKPRRNQDYQAMIVVPKWSDKLSNEINYLDVKNKQFVFNRFKTAKTYGRQIVGIPESFQSILQVYLKQHPSRKAGAYSFLVKPGGEAFGTVNSITRVLNHIFGKNIGSSMLRHSYLTSKYGKDSEFAKMDAEKKDVAGEMAHSVETQNAYVKN